MRLVLQTFIRIFTEQPHADLWGLRRLRWSSIWHRHYCAHDGTRQGVSFYGGKVLPSYKILYLLLGGLAIVVGIIVLIGLPDSPVHAHMLSREERIAALERVRNDQGGTESKAIKKEQIREALTDIRTWLIVLSTMLSTCVVTTLVTRLTRLAASIPNGALSNCRVTHDRRSRSMLTLLLC